MKLLISAIITISLAMPCLAGQMPVNISKYLNNDGISAEGNINKGSLDKGGYAFPAEEFPAGGSITHNGIKFKLAQPSATKNNISCVGQTIKLPVGKISKIHVLAAAVNGNYIEDITIKRSDGSTYDVDFAISDWCVPAEYNEQAAIKFTHRRNTKPVQPKCNIWEQTIHLKKTGRPVTSIKLPNKPDIHIFAITTE
ncbi:MAG: hypothetical protein ACYC27_07800 [Armatimonadota bacterium]